MTVGYVQAAAKGSLAFRMVSPVSGSYPILGVSECVPLWDGTKSEHNRRESGEETCVSQLQLYSGNRVLPNWSLAGIIHAKDLHKADKDRFSTGRPLQASLRSTKIHWPCIFLVFVLRP